MEQNSHINYQSSHLDWHAQPNIWQPNSFPAHMNPYFNETSSNGLSPSSASTDLPLSMMNQPHETNNWFHSLPHSHHALNSTSEKNLPTETCKKAEGHGNLPFGTGCSQKQFIIFDQSSKQTTMMYSCKIGTPVCFMNLGDQNQPCNWRKEDHAMNKDVVSHSDPLLVGQSDENRNDHIRSDMHEDTEELNALLYSDDDTGTDEETSTGHSPSNATIPRVEDWFKSHGEEVASSAGSTKRQKLLDGGHDKPLAVTDTALMDTASSLKCLASPNTEHDTQSSCGNAVNQFNSVSGKKRSRKEGIHDTIQIFQKVVPGCKGKEIMDVIDEAIHYLQSLKSVANNIGLAAL